MGSRSLRKAPSRGSEQTSRAPMALGQNTADPACRRPMWFLEGKNKEQNVQFQLIASALHYCFNTVTVTWPALGYVETSISSGLAWKFWILSQFLVKCVVIGTPWKSKSTPRVGTYLNEESKTKVIVSVIKLSDTWWKKMEHHTQQCVCCISCSTKTFVGVWSNKTLDFIKAHPSNSLSIFRMTFPHRNMKRTD